MLIPYLNDEHEPITSEMIADYRRDWAAKGFPDVGGGKHEDVLNNPAHAPTVEQELWRSVLLQAIADLERGSYPRPNKHQRADAANALAWFLGDGGEIASFRWVCDVLGFNPGWVRKQIALGVDLGRSHRYAVISNPHGRRGKPVDKDKTMVYPEAHEQTQTD